MKIKKTLKTLAYEIPLIWRFDYLQKTILTIASIFSDSITSRVREILKSESQITYIQIGANDGISSDPIFELAVKDPRWTGLLIEPLPTLFKKLKHNYKGTNFTFANVAIAEQNGDLPFYYLDDQFKDKNGGSIPYFYDQLGSFDPQHILKHFGQDAEEFLRKIDVKTVTLKKVLSDNSISKIDLLHIDAEGFDWLILKQLDFDIFKPKIIVYEHKHLTNEEKQESISALINQGYEIVDFGLDYLAIRN